jgi:phosphotriesterase-related protein
MARTDLHLHNYYPATSWLWSASLDQAFAYFVDELTIWMRETNGTIRATSIKVGYDGMIGGQTRKLMEAAAGAAHQTGVAALLHTEEGMNVGALLPFFANRGVPPDRLYLRHIDKCPDIGLHGELARAGVLLGYDTFVRPKDNQSARRLIHALVADGLDGSIAIGLNLAMASMWRRYGGQPGLLFLNEQVLPRLRGRYRRVRDDLANGAECRPALSLANPGAMICYDTRILETAHRPDDVLYRRDHREVVDHEALPAVVEHSEVGSVDRGL